MLLVYPSAFDGPISFALHRTFPFFSPFCFSRLFSVPIWKRNQLWFSPTIKSNKTLFYTFDNIYYGPFGFKTEGNRCIFLHIEGKNHFQYHKLKFHRNEVHNCMAFLPLVYTNAPLICEIPNDTGNVYNTGLQKWIRCTSKQYFEKFEALKSLDLNSLSGPFI